MKLIVATILLGIGSLVFLWIAIARVYGYVRKYALCENEYTLLLGFIHLRHVTYLYVFSVVALLMLSIGFVLSL